LSLFLSGEIGGKLQCWALEGDALGLGRSSKHPIHIPDGTVSKDHAQILRRGAGWTIRDLGSRNGTRVNGAEARAAVALAAGDRVEVGHVQLAVTDGPPSAPVRFSDSTVLGSSFELRAGEILERRARTSGSGRLVHLLAEAGRLLVLPRPLRETCDELLRFIEQAVPASRYVLLLASPGGEPVPMASRERGAPSNRPLALSRAILGKVLDECTSVLTADAAVDPRFQGAQSIIAQSVRSAMAGPLFDDEKVLGLVYVDSRDPGVSFGEEQLELLTLLANMAAVKITNARLLESEQAHARVAQELAAAAEIQRGLLPVDVPRVPGWRFDAFLESCYEVGGDLYDFHTDAEGRLLCALGDVSGKGMGAALLMSSFLSSVRVLYDACPDLAELARRLNVITHRSTDAGRFVTGIVGRLEPATGRFEFVNAGHPSPAHVARGEVRRLASGGPPFGILPASEYAVQSTEIRPGDLLAFYSDGIPEARHEGEFFEEERLDRVLLDAPRDEDLASLRRRVLAAVEAFVGDEPRGDDLTLLLVGRDA
jgi:phosphoserine phosphatase RsbU/P